MQASLDTLILWANTSLAAGAVMASVAGMIGDDPRQRPMWGAIAALAALYVGGYVWVLAGADVELWSRIFRGVSLAAWPIVWIMPPIRAVVVRRRDVARLRTAAADVKRRIAR